MGFGLKFSSSKNVVRRTCVALLLLSIFAYTFVGVGFAAPQIDVTVNSSKVIGTSARALRMVLSLAALPVGVVLLALPRLLPAPSIMALTL